MSQASSFHSLLLPEARIFRARYACSVSMLLSAAELAAPRLSPLFGSQWRLDGHTSTTLFLWRSVPPGGWLPSYCQIEGFDLLQGPDFAGVALFTRHPTSQELFEAFTAQLDMFLVRLPD